MLKRISTFVAHEERVWDVEWSPDGLYLASCGADKKIRIWSEKKPIPSTDLRINPLLDTQESELQEIVEPQWVERQVLEGQHKRTVRRITWSPDSSYLSACSFDSTVTVWKENPGKKKMECIATLEGHENEVKSSSWNSTGNLLATCSRDKSVWIWEMESDQDFECVGVLQGHTQDVKSVHWHPTEDILCSCGYDNTIKLWREDPDEDEWECFDTLNSHTSTVWDVSWMHDNLVSCSDDLTVKIWEPLNTKGKKKYHNTITLQGDQKRSIYSVDTSLPLSHLSPFGNIASCSGDNSICIYTPSLESRQGGIGSGVTYNRRVKLENAHREDVNCVRWNPTQQNLLASCSDDGNITIWSFIDE